jgi:hypothetical protein
MPDIDSAEPDDEANSELAEAHLAQHSRQQPSPASLKLPNLNAFASVQRQIAGLDLSVVTAAHRELSQAIVAANAPTIAAAQEAARAYFARSIDFSRLATAQRAVMSNAAVAAMPARLEWAKALGAAIDVSALEHAYNAILSTDALRTVQESNRAVTEALRSRVDLSAEAVKALQLGLPRLDFAKVLQAFGRWIPKNLRDVDDLEGVAKVTLDEGVPLSWVPRTEIVVELLNAATVDERLKILQLGKTTCSTTARPYSRSMSTNAPPSASRQSGPSAPDSDHPPSHTRPTSSIASCSACWVRMVALKPASVRRRTSTSFRSSSRQKISPSDPSSARSQNGGRRRRCRLPPSLPGIRPPMPWAIPMSSRTPLRSSL